MFVFPVEDNVLVAANSKIAANPSQEWSEVKENILQQYFPLHQACRDGNVNKLIDLLAAVAESKTIPSFSASDPFYGWMPAHWATYFGKTDCLQLIVRASRYVDVPSPKLFQTPTHVAAFAGHANCLKWLLDHGGDPSRWDYMKETPLHKAARTGSIECIALLVGRGAPLHWTNIDGKTATQLAEESCHNEAASYLNLQLQLNCNIQSQPTIPSSYNVSSGGYYGHHPVAKRDVGDALLSNVESIGGRKRGRESLPIDPEQDIKRSRAEVTIINRNQPTAGTKCLMSWYL